MTKYKAKKTEVDGIVFDSKKEAKRYGELNIMRRLGVISDLKLQVKIPFVVNDKTCFTYVADFSYVEGDSLIFEDVKGFKTPVYKLKKKILEAANAIKIRET